MNKYDAIVVGAGAGGLTMALILARTGRRVLVLEKSPKPGGALGSFDFSGYRLDAGFHFTGALQDGGLFDQLLKALDIREMINSIFLSPDSANIFRFAESNVEISFPYGMNRMRESLTRQFPAEGLAIERYLDDIDCIRSNTPALDLKSVFSQAPILPEDSVTLKDYLEGLTSNHLLRETLSALIMCHGSAPSEISMADNSRLCAGFYESVATIEGGGSSLVNALIEQLRKFDVEIRCGTEIITLAGIDRKKVGSFVLNTGETFSTEACVFTINPKSIVDILPRDAFPPAFFQRIESFEATPGFFTLFAKLDEDAELINPLSITSEYPVDDINALALPAWNGPGALALMHSKSNGANILTAFEPIYWKQVASWAASNRKNRPEAYLQWKRNKKQEVLQRIFRIFPSYRDRLEVLTSATPLTYKDYINHHDGAAYGIKTKVGQYNLAGQLRLRNLYMAGQSAILPGVLGTMMASLIVAKTIVGENQIKKILDGS